MATGHAQLDAIAAALGESTAHVCRFLERGEQAFHQRPAAAAWSAAECVQHLSLTTRAYLPMIDAALATTDTRGVGADHRYRPDLLGRFLAWLLAPPFRTKTKTASPFVPVAVGTGAEVIAEFHGLQEDLVQRVQRCRGRDLERIRLASPFNARVKYNMYSAFLILVAHERRHLVQADRALAFAAAPVD